MADYSLAVIDNEDQMKNYFRNKTGRQYKDTLIVTVKNTGKKYWERFKGQIKCYESDSNIYFETLLISEDVAPNGSIELVLTFPRYERNCGAGDMFTSLQLSYKDVDYNYQKIYFFKRFNLTGITVIVRPSKKVELDENKKKEEEEKERKHIEDLNRRIEEKRKEEERKKEEYRKWEEQRRKADQQRLKDEIKKKMEEKRNEEEKKKKANEESLKQDRKRIIEETKRKRELEKKKKEEEEKRKKKELLKKQREKEN